jgi:hypothetical protein
MQKTKSRSTEGIETASASQLIDARIKELGDWRAETLARVRMLIQQADPDVVEEWKWGVPVWSHAGIICTGESYKNAVKLTFAHGASLEDPSALFNSSLDGNTRRAIDIRVNDKVDEKALKALIRAAVALNTSKQAGARKKTRSARFPCGAGDASADRRQVSDQLVERDRIVPHAEAGRVMDGIRHCRADTADAELADALGLHR